jgi:hypothetical protein
MAEVLAVALAALAVCLSYAADGPRHVPRWPFLRAPGSARAARISALVPIAAAIVLWNRAEPGPAAYLAVPLAVLVAGTLLTLGAPLVLGRRHARSARAATRRAPGAEAALESEALSARESAAPLAALKHELASAPTLRARLGRSALVLGVTLGTLPVALLASAAVARFLPVSADARFATGFALVIPLWQLCMCIALLARRGGTLLTLCGALSLALAALVFGIQP